MDNLENYQFKKLPDVTANSGSTSAQFRPPMCPPDVAARRAAILLGCYRKGDAEDPQTYAAAMASILSMYPQPVAYLVTDPRTGLASKSQWLPTVAEVKQACEAAIPRADEERSRDVRPVVAEKFKMEISASDSPEKFREPLRSAYRRGQLFAADFRELNALTFAEPRA